MSGKRCGARVCRCPHGQLKDSKRDFLWSLAGGITPRQSASIHKIFTRIPQDFRKNYTRIATEYHKKLRQNNHMESNRKQQK